jgi:serpin B
MRCTRFICGLGLTIVVVATAGCPQPDSLVDDAATTDSLVDNTATTEPLVEDATATDPPVDDTAPTDPPVYGTEIQSDKLRNTAPSVESADLAALVAGNNQFAVDMYKALGEQGGNVLFSPHSISIALAMTYAGARGQTETQMASTLHFTLPQAQLHPAFDALDLALAERGQTGGFQLSVANRMWGQDGYYFLPDFLDVLAVNYGAGLALLDFAGDTEGARTTINDWVSDETVGRIPELIPENVLSDRTRFVLTNAVYFNADWQSQFEAEFTHPAPFTLLDDSTVTVDMMSQTASLNYVGCEAYQAVQLPYVGGQVAMVILLPAAGTFDAFEQSLDAEALASILGQLTSPQTVFLKMPKFTDSRKRFLKSTLKQLGMIDAFDAADFSGMDGTRKLFIGEVIHEAFVKVDEKGTEAAAATAVIGEEVSPGPSPLPLAMVVDRPFLFLIRDIPTGAILFMGRVVNPL